MSTTTKQQIQGTLRDLVEAGRIADGDKVEIRRRAGNLDGTIVEPGAIRFEGKDYDSPSGAAKVALGTAAVNGWAVWRLCSTGAPLGELRDGVQASPRTTRERKAAKASSPERIERQKRAREQAAALAIWKAGGEVGDRPATPDLDAMNGEYQEKEATKAVEAVKRAADKAVGAPVKKATTRTTKAPAKATPAKRTTTSGKRTAKAEPRPKAPAKKAAPRRSAAAKEVTAEAS